MTRWAELVFHVLAHVHTTAHLAASAWDPIWVRFVAAQAGAATQRTLAEDVALIGRLVQDHGSLVRLQTLAWLFDDADRARQCAERSIVELAPEHVDRPELLSLLSRPDMATAVEVLRAAAELEADVYASLPAARSSSEDLGEALLRTACAAPHLGRCAVVPIRPLRLRGRVWHDVIWTGLPCDELGPSVRHVAWQAAHEATVREVWMAARSVPNLVIEHDPLEQSAVALLAARADRVGASADHRQWLQHLAACPPLERESLAQPWRGLVEALFASDARG